MSNAVSKSKMNPSVVVLFPIPLTSMLLMMVAEPGTMWEGISFVDVGGVGGDAVIDDVVTVGLREEGWWLAYVGGRSRMV